MSQFKFDFPFGGGERPPSQPSKPRQMPKFQRPGPLVITLAILIVIGLFIFAAASLWTEVLWYNQVGYARILWTQWIGRGVLFLVSAIIVGIIVFINMRIPYKTRGSAIEDPDSSMPRYRNSVDGVRKAMNWIVPLLLAIPAGVSTQGYWKVFLMWINSTPFGQKDPQFGIDVSFYVFTLPALQAIVGFLTMLTIIAAAVAAVSYYVYGGLVLTGKKKVSRPARIHLSILAAILSLMVGIRYYLDRYELLNSSTTKFDGAGYTAINAILPAKTILAIISVAIVLLFIFSATRNSWRLPVIGIGVMVVSALIIGTGYPALVQKFRVDPSAQQMEAEYIQRNIDATLKAFDLADVEMQTYRAKTETTAGQLRKDSESTASIRLVDPNVVSPTFRQLQQNRQYYNFSRQLGVDRYNIEDQRRDTVIAVRELDLEGLGRSQRTWVNDHTVYTHGFGVVAAYGNATQSDGRPGFWEQGIPSTGEMGEYEPRVYFGQRSPEYSIVGAPEGAPKQELDYPDDKAPNGQVNTTYTGNGGPSVGNFFNKLLYTIKFGSTELFFSEQVNGKSQILYDRDPALRVSKVAPYLTLDETVYPAVVDIDDNPATPKRLVWIVDGYTTTDAYPYSAKETLGQAAATTGIAGMLTSGNNVNYMRNSVKAVVDAYDGKVTLYQWDQKDPVLRTWMNIFPDQVRPVTEISGDLMSHLRYPEDLFKVQRDLLSRYHVQDARSFYSGGDFWQTPPDPTGKEGQPLPPYYLTMKMPGQETAEFSLTTVFIPGGNTDRNVLTGYLAVDSETGSDKGKIREGYGKLRLLELPRDMTVPGPGQVQNNFNSTQRVSTQLNLLEQAASKVVRGNLLTLPVGDGLLYVQPVYVQASGGTSFPLLKSVLVAFGDRVGFAPTLQEALDQVFGGDSGAVTVDGDKTGGEGTDTPGGATGPVLSAQQRLTQALQEAKTALDEGNTALKGGDWSAYGKAQEKLDAALQKALSVQAEIDGTAGAATDTGAGATPAPTASPDATGTVEPETPKQ